MVERRTIKCDVCGDEFEGHTLDARRVSVVSKVGPNVDGQTILSVDYCSKHGIHRVAFEVAREMIDSGDQFFPSRWSDD